MPRDSGRAGVVSLPGRRRRGGQVPVDGLTVREMLGQDAMRGTRIIAGAGGLDRVVRRLNVMTVPNIVRWTKQDEFLLTTGYPLPREPGEFGALIEQLAAKGLAGLGVKLDEYLAEVPADAVELADRAAFPIVVIPATSPLDDVLSQTFETIVNRQAAALARRQQIHDAFLRVALTGGGLARLSGELAEILPGADVVICDPAGYPLAATTRSHDLRDSTGRVTGGWLVAGVHKNAETGTPWAAAVIRAGEMRHGWVLAVGGARGLPGTAGVAVEQAALVAALEITRDLAVLAVEQQFASNALHNLVTGTAGDLDQALERAVRFGWDLRRPLAVLVARLSASNRGYRSERGSRPSAGGRRAARGRAVDPGRPRPGPGRGGGRLRHRTGGRGRRARRGGPGPQDPHGPDRVDRARLLGGRQPGRRGSAGHPAAVRRGPGGAAGGPAAQRQRRGHQLRRARAVPADQQREPGRAGGRSCTTRSARCSTCPSLPARTCSSHWPCCPAPGSTWPSRPASCTTTTTPCATG